MADRRMIYPYTFTAKIVQFPYRYHWKNCWSYKFTIIAHLVGLPFFWKLQKLSYSPVNVANYEKSMRKNHEEHQKHLSHLL